VRALSPDSYGHIAVVAENTVPVRETPLYQPSVEHVTAIVPQLSSLLCPVPVDMIYREKLDM